MPIKTVKLPSGDSVPQLGQGTWMMGEGGRDRASEIRALQVGIELGMRLIDTAEMYADGIAEEITGEAIAGRREEVFLVSKVLPSHASHEQVVRACERSLKRLNTDRLDLYLLHWRGNYALEDTISGFEALRTAGKIGSWGVSNFDVEDMEDLFAAGGSAVAANQVLYNLTRRGVEYDLFPWQAERGIASMAYSPIEQGRLVKSYPLRLVAEARGVTPAQMALAFTLLRDDVISIPKSGSEAHVRDNRAAAELVLTAEEIAALDEAFPPPEKKSSLEML